MAFDYQEFMRTLPERLAAEEAAKQRARRKEAMFWAVCLAVDAAGLAAIACYYGGTAGLLIAQICGTCLLTAALGKVLIKWLES